MTDLQSRLDNEIISSYWNKYETARSKINSIKRKKTQNDKGKSIGKVNVIIITDKMAFMIIKEIRTKFLQFDNLDETRNRIVIIFSEIALEVMQIAKDWHLDRTFKNCPNFFQQLS